MAARTSASASRIGTTMPGSTTTSSSGSTGSFTVSVKIATLSIQKVEFNGLNHGEGGGIPR
jgi:hypothetical protein